VITVHGYVTKDQTPTEYVPDAGTDDPVKLLREKDIQIRHLKALLAEADDEIAKRERVIGALIADGLGNATPPLDRSRLYGPRRPQYGRADQALPVR
jgi:hypothetical protein